MVDHFIEVLELQENLNLLRSVGDRSQRIDHTDHQSDLHPILGRVFTHRESCGELILVPWIPEKIPPAADWVDSKLSLNLINPLCLVVIEPVRERCILIYETQYLNTEHCIQRESLSRGHENSSEERFEVDVDLGRAHGWHEVDGVVEGDPEQDLVRENIEGGEKVPDLEREGGEVLLFCGYYFQVIENYEVQRVLVRVSLILNVHLEVIILVYLLLVDILGVLDEQGFRIDFDHNYDHRGVSLLAWDGGLRGIQNKLVVLVGLEELGLEVLAEYLLLQFQLLSLDALAGEVVVDYILTGPGHAHSLRLFQLDDIQILGDPLDDEFGRVGTLPISALDEN